MGSTIWPSDVEHFQRLYETKQDEDILELWLRRDSLEEAAAEALNRVIVAKQVDLQSLAAEQSEEDFRAEQVATENDLRTDRFVWRMIKVMVIVALPLFLWQLAMNPGQTLERPAAALVQALVGGTLLGLCAGGVYWLRSFRRRRRNR